tara:strand:- start:56 stop:169 length:114 start_codon:yes stop_codon:yes gene_type:complete
VEIYIFKAIATEPLSKNSPPKKRSAKPRINKIVGVII